MTRATSSWRRENCMYDGVFSSKLSCSCSDLFLYRCASRWEEMSLGQTWTLMLLEI